MPPELRCESLLRVRLFEQPFIRYLQFVAVAVLLQRTPFQLHTSVLPGVLGVHISSVCRVDFNTEEVITSLPIQQVSTKNLETMESYGNLRL